MTTFQPANEQLGYCFHPPTAEQPLGHPQLDVVIRPTPTEEHFDPESFTCLVLTPSGGSQLRVQHPWTLGTTYQVCAGSVFIEDRLHECLQAFTFGGTLAIESDHRRTVCRLASPVPILEHSSQALTPEEWLIEEVHILCAERRAAQDNEAFERRLAVANPKSLYHACLTTLLEKFKHFLAADDGRLHFRQALLDAVQALEGEVAPALDKLL